MKNAESLAETKKYCYHLLAVSLKLENKKLIVKENVESCVKGEERKENEF